MLDRVGIVLELANVIESEDTIAPKNKLLIHCIIKFVMI
jgi:hypothetical protein